MGMQGCNRIARFKYPAKCEAIDGSGTDAEPDDPAVISIHDEQEPVGPQRGRFSGEQIQNTETVFHVANERQPGRTTEVFSRLIVAGENPSNNVIVDWDGKSEGYLVTDSWTGPGAISLLHLINDSVDEFFAGQFRSGLTPALG